MANVHKIKRDFEVILRNDPDLKDDEELIQKILNYGKKETVKIVQQDKTVIWANYFHYSFWDTHSKFMQQYKNTAFELEVKRQFDEERKKNGTFW